MRDCRIGRELITSRRSGMPPRSARFCSAAASDVGGLFQTLIAQLYACETARVLEWFQQLARPSTDARAGPALPALLAGGRARMMNFARALDNGILTVHRGAFALAP